MTKWGEGWRRAEGYDISKGKGKEDIDSIYNIEQTLMDQEKIH